MNLFKRNKEGQKIYDFNIKTKSDELSKVLSAMKVLQHRDEYICNTYSSDVEEAIDTLLKFNKKLLVINKRKDN